MRPEPTVVDDFTRDVLRNCRVEGRVVKLPGRLRTPDFKVIKNVFDGMGGQWDRRSEAFVFDTDPAGPIGAAVSTGRFVDRRKTLQQLETPPDLAAHVAGLCDIRAASLLLEPSAGTGQLCKAALAQGADVAAIERDHANIQALLTIDDPRLRVWHDDFLRWADRQPAAVYDRVLMHPPFTGGADIAHVQAAWRQLKADGRLVAIVSDAAFISTEIQAVFFRDWLAEIGAEEKAVALDASGGEIQARVIIADRESRT